MKSILRIAVFFAASLAFAANAFFLPPPPPTAVEFVNTFTNRHVWIFDRAEWNALATGGAGPGWKLTGYSFTVSEPVGDAVGNGNICRFYNPASNSHFFTGFPDECNALRANPASGWIYEKIAFADPLPSDGRCALGANTFEVRRLYNNAEGTHRFTPDLIEYGDLVRAGWIDEGVAWCTASWSHTPAKSFTIVSGKLAPTGECEDESLNLGSCVALNQLPRMPNSVSPFLPPWWVVQNPEFPSDVGRVTGSSGAHDLFTAYPVADKAAVVSHSFLQTDGTSPFFGIHVNSLDRTVGEFSSINPLYQFTTRAPATGEPDARVFPWGDGRDNYLDISFALQVATVRRFDPQGQAIGHPTLQFVDRASGKVLYVTLGAYGTVPAADDEDRPARDVGTGRVIVYTTFRDNPSFGRVLWGRWITCAGDGPCDRSGDFYEFRMDRAAFQYVLEKARTLDPTLPADPTAWFLANFHFNNEVYGNGEIGMSLTSYKLDIFER